MTDEGVSFVTGVDAADTAVARRLMEEYDAVVLCCGAGRPRPLGLEGGDMPGVCYGTAFLKAAVERQVFGQEPALPTAEGRHVVVIGTGDTASDCVATALRQGCASVTQLVRRPKSDYLVQRRAAHGLCPRGGRWPSSGSRPPALLRPGEAVWWPAKTAP